MKIAVYLRNKDIGPSCYYRIYQYLENNILEEKVFINEYSSLRNYNISRKLDNSKKISILFKGYLYFIGLLRRIIQMFFDLKIRKVEKIIIQRELFPKHLPYILSFFLEKYLQRINYIIWDFDDYIDKSGEISSREYRLLCRYSTKILVSTEYLKDTLPLEFQSKCVVLHTTDKAAVEINLNDINKSRLRLFETEINLVWIGTASNIQYLKNIINYLDDVARYFTNQKKINLKVVSNVKVNVETTHLFIENITWSREIAIKELINSHIGLMPLTESDFSLGKAGFKGVQYIGMGLPTVVSKIGFNNQVVINNHNGYTIELEDDWSKVIIELCRNKDKWIYQSIAAREHWINKFNAGDNQGVILSLLKN